jgi:uncharacterized protein YjiS (DUF1127 family)
MPAPYPAHWTNSMTWQVKFTPRRTVLLDLRGHRFRAAASSISPANEPEDSMPQSNINDAPKLADRHVAIHLRREQRQARAALINMTARDLSDIGLTACDRSMALITHNWFDPDSNRNIQTYGYRHLRTE